MNEKEAFEALRPMAAQVLGVKPERILMESALVGDLGAESIDLLDLTFSIEERFGVTIEANEFERAARKRIPGGVYEKDGYLTPEALEELRRALPEVDPARFGPGLRRTDVPSLLTVGVFVHLILRKIEEKGRHEPDA